MCSSGRAIQARSIGGALGPPIALEPVAIDGKAMRGVREQPLPGAYLLSAFASRRAVLAQLAIGEREKELSHALPLLRQIGLSNVLVTGDAMFAQRSLCAHIVEHGALPVRSQGQPASARAGAAAFLSRRSRRRRARGRLTAGHGQIDIRTLHARAGLDDAWVTWPGSTLSPTAHRAQG